MMGALGHIVLFGKGNDAVMPYSSAQNRKPLKKKPLRFSGKVS